MRILTPLTLFTISACDSGSIEGVQSSDAALSDATVRVDSRTGGEGSDGSLDADANVSNGTNPSNGSGGDFPGAKVRSAPLTGGWVPGSDISRYSVALDYVLAAYNVEQDRIYIWGFSAGAHIVHGVALTNTDTFTG